MLRALGRVAAGCVLLASCIAQPALDLRRDPQVLGRTVSADVGDRFTVGMHGPYHDSVTAVDPWLPIRITAVEVVASGGVRIVGVGVHDLSSDGVGFVEGWPPRGAPLRAVDDAVYTTEWDERVFTVIGYELTAETAGIRGIKVSWTNSRGEAHSRIFDIASLTCAPGRCNTDEDERDTLFELGLLRP